jgi:hypothetical protein
MKRHVPELRKILISLRVLDFGSYKCTVQGGVLKVSKGILVVMKVKWIESLCHLEERTESIQAVVVYEGASDYTRL